LKIDKKILIFAVLIGLLTVFGLGSYINKLTNVQEKPVAYSQVVIATDKILENTKVTATMVTLKSVPAESIHAEAITSLDKIIGKVSKVEIVKDEQILSSRIVMDATKATLAYRVPQNMRAISMPYSEVSGVAGFINVGAKIDIIVTYTKEKFQDNSATSTQLQNIEVAAVGNAKLSVEDNQKALPASITVLVKPEQAEVIAYAISNGTLSFTLRNPVDTGKTPIRIYNSTNISANNER
jgi:pilus assembly protein CpaB